MLRKLLRIVLLLLGVVVLLFGVVLAIAYAKQRTVVEYAVAEINRDMAGTLTIGGSHIAPFEAFPLMCIDLENVQFHASNDTTQAPIYTFNDLYLCFRIWDLLRGYFDVQSVHATGGHLDLVQHPDGSLNLLLAKQFATAEEEDGSALHIHLRDLQLRDFTFSHLQENTGQKVTARIHHLKADFRSIGDSIASEVEADLHLDVIGKRDTSFFYDKHIVLDVHLDYDMATQVLKMPLSSLKLQEVEFHAEGSIDISHEVDLDLHVHGEKPDFSLLTAFAPNELADFLKQFKNAGNIFFDGTVKGRSALGRTPHVHISFGCTDGWFENPATKKRVEQLAFNGHFTNGGDPTLHKAEFHLLDLNLRPGSGVFSGDLVVVDFVEPFIDVDLHCDLDLDFIGKFLNVEVVKELSGHVQVDMKLTELIDIEAPERNLARLKQGIDSDLRVKDLHVRLPGHPHPIDDLDIHAQMRQGFVEVDTFSLRMASSDLRLRGSISDLPALFHHQEKPIELKLAVAANKLDLSELLAHDTALARSQNEVLTGLSTHLHFVTSVSGLLDHEPLPIGEFFIDDLTVKAKHYPHRLHDVHVDILISDSTLRIKDLAGTIDASDLHFNGLVKDYDLWFSDRRTGETHVAVDFRSDQLVLHDLLTYRGENHLPQEYRDEVLREARFHADADLRFADNTFRSADLRVTKLTGRMKVHPLKLEDFHGHLHVEDDVLTIDDLGGRMGRTDLAADLRVYLGDDPAKRKAPDQLHLRSRFLDLDALMNYSPERTVDHDSAFNIFSLPFPDLELTTDVGTLKYHRYDLKDFRTRLHLKPDHTLQVDTLSVRIAQGEVGLKGTFTAKDPKDIRFTSELVAKDLDLDALMIKFDNFGQDVLLNRNLHGRVSGRVRSTWPMHADLTPIMEKGEAHLDITVVDGSLVQFTPMHAMAEFFVDKNLDLVRFDTLRNELHLKDGVLDIPAMNLNSSLGFMEISGKQGMDLTMDYYLRIPWSLVTQAASAKLFGGRRKEEVEPDQVDAIQYRDTDKRVRFLNVRVTGTPDKYEVSLGRDRRSPR
ncbi:MAG: hypothetical protein JNL52_09895 [Flavobacteriales bacterium]|nr:hypothetical protein [Flavobacteriales bacterium]